MRNLEEFKEVLDTTYEWPDYYTFKFIIKSQTKDQFEELFNSYQLSYRPSKKGNYLSITFRVLIKQSEEVVNVYQQASQIPGLMSL